MEKNILQIKYFSNKYIVFILIISVFVLLPALILTYSVYRYYQISEEENILFLKSNINRIASELRRNLSCEKYFCRFFHEYYLSELNEDHSNIKTCKEFCKNLKNFYGNKIDFVILDNYGDIEYNSNPNVYRYTHKEWYETLTFVKNSINIFNKNVKVAEHKRDNIHVDNKGIFSAKKILGSKVDYRSFLPLFQENEYSLIWGDNTELIPPCAAYDTKWGGFFVFFSRDLLRDSFHLRYAIQESLLNKNILAGLYNSENIKDNFWVSKEVKDLDKVKKFVEKYDTLGRNFIETDSLYISNQFLTKDKRFFTVSRKNNSLLKICLKAFCVFVLYLLLSLPIIRYFWNTIILVIPGKSSIRLKLAFLFLFATGIPLLSLAVISYEYQLHKRMAMIEESKTWTADNMLEIEQRYLSYLKSVRVDIDNYIDNKWILNLKTEGLTSNSIKEIESKLLKYNTWDFFCTASEASFIGSYDGLLKYTGSLDDVVFDKKNSILHKPLTDYRYYELRMVNLLLKKICSDLNNSTIPGMILNKMELFAESVMQKSFPEIIYSVVDTRDTIKEFGFGTHSNMSYFKFISVNDKKLTDYILLITWLPKDIQKQFIMKIIPETNRNPNNYKLISYERNNREFFPESYARNNVLEHFVRRASDKPSDDLEIINIDGEEYIAVSILGHKLSEFSFVGLYPLRNIDSVINYKCYVLWILGVFCLLLSISLAQLLTKSFVNPMLNLQEGAHAIEIRNFDHRISNLNSDEFGEVGNIFNNMMVGLKELEVAKIVQESMFPKPEFEQGKFSIYGKSVTMIDVGGDYLDFFKVDDNSFSLLLGDVAGHGVGAAMIMAMAKASIIAASDSWKSPSAMLNLLHKVILASKTAKQRKIMTFQYLHINSDTGENLYSCAGACSPFLVRHNENYIEELKVPGAVLGAFKKAVYKEKTLDLRPGDAVVFYTDGIIECKNKMGEMLGYDRLKELLLQCWNDNPEVYYNNIYKSYLDYVGSDKDAEDDLTIIVLEYKAS